MRNRMMMVAAATLLVLELSGAAGRSLLQANLPTLHGDHVHFGQQDQLRTRIDFDHTIDPLELRGLWFGDGDQYAANVWDIFSNATALPDCNAHQNEFNYSHYNPSDPHYIMLFGTQGQLNRTTAAHKITTPQQVLNYTDNLMYISTVSTGAITCSHFKPYIDLTTGWLKAEILNINMYTRNATGFRVAQSMNCQALGNEIPGCYTGQIARGPPLIGTKSYSAASPSSASSPSVAALSIPSGGVVSVNRVTYTCMNGECLTLAPKFASDDHDH